MPVFIRFPIYTFLCPSVHFFALYFCILSNNLGFVFVICPVFLVFVVRNLLSVSSLQSFQSLYLCLCNLLNYLLVFVYISALPIITVSIMSSSICVLSLIFLFVYHLLSTAYLFTEVERLISISCLLSFFSDEGKRASSLTPSVPRAF